MVRFQVKNHNAIRCLVIKETCDTMEATAFKTSLEEWKLVRPYCAAGRLSAFKTSLEEWKPMEEEDFIRELDF